MRMRIYKNIFTNIPYKMYNLYAYTYKQEDLAVVVKSNNRPMVLVKMIGNIIAK